MAERSVEMAVNKPKIKSMKYEDFKDNEYIDQLVDELNASGANVVVGKFDQLMNWGRANSLWPFCFGTSCCAIEFMCLGAARYDMARYGAEVARNSPRQSDYIMVQGTITYRMAPALRRLYEQLAEPRYVIACGGCAVSGGPFKKSYCVVKGVDQILPVDVYLPGCPPRPEAMFYALMQLQRKIKVQKFFGGANRKEKIEDFFAQHAEEVGKY
jgi:NADH-quinone oxidoreductase subunit B